MLPRAHDLYAVLGIAHDASAGEIKTAYRVLAKCHHPDRNLGFTELATERFKEIEAAYSVLSDPARRAAYDRGN